MYDVCVVGGGLGGLALAVGLEQLVLDWQLCESAEELRLVSSLPPPPPARTSWYPHHEALTMCSACLPAGLQLAHLLDWEAMGCTLWRRYHPSSSRESSE